MQLLSYPGGKASLAPWITSHFPEHSSYCEPFGGSAAVLLEKPKAPLEIYNDLSGDAVNFFRVLRDHGDELRRRLMLTPYSRETDEAPTEDLIEKARRFFHLSNTRWHNGTFKRQKRNPERGTLTGVYDRARHYLDIAAERLAFVHFENSDALACIGAHDDAAMLFYVDPPYFGDRKRNLYALEMMDEERHVLLADGLTSVKGRVILSGYSTPLYEKLYSGWEKRISVGSTMGKATKVECLWIKPSSTPSVHMIALPSKPVTPAAKLVQRRVKAAATSAHNGQSRSRGRPKKIDTVSIYSQEERARSSGVGLTSQKRLDKIARNRPELLEQIAAGKLSISKAAKLCGGTDAPGQRELGQGAWPGRHMFGAMSDAPATPGPCCKAAETGWH